MRKIPTIFKRNPENMGEILEEPNSDCQWVFDGEGVATRKYDGTCVLIEYDGSYWKRREVKKGKKAPSGFISLSTDPITGKTVGWVKVNPDDPGDKYHMEAFIPTLQAGTYELIGPKIQGNPEKTVTHSLIAHADAEVYPTFPRSRDGIEEFLAGTDIEGIVFHHPDGRMGKIKKRDFGLKRK